MKPLKSLPYKINLKKVFLKDTIIAFITTFLLVSFGNLNICQVGASPSPAGRANLQISTMQNATDTSSDYFTIAVLPDTQYYSEQYPVIFDQQAQWIVDNAATQNIVFVSQVGDLVEDYNNDSEWVNAQHSMGIIRNAGISYSVVPGNHDISKSTGDTTYYDKYFPYTDFTSYSWYGNGHYPPPNGVPSPNYPANSNTSNYETFSAMGQNFVILNLACTPNVLVNPSLYAWANDVLSCYSKYKAIVVTHGYIDTDGNYTDSSNVSGVEIWNNVVNPNNNVVAVICGHVWGECHESITAEHGNTVENLLFDSQNDPNCGDGWLRLYKFYPQLNEVSVSTYSPYLDQYDTTSAGQFNFGLNMTKTSTVTLLTASANPSAHGQSVTFAAAISPIPDGGTVQFRIDDTNFGSPVIISNGSAVSIPTSTLTTVNHTITAVYSGDTNFAGSMGTLVQIITSSASTAWDLNGDHICNIGDVVVVGLHWGETGTAGWIPEDLNDDGAINIGDVVTIGLHWGQTW